MSDYNGWTNWATWNANLFLTNDEVIERELRKCYKAEQVKTLFLDYYTDLESIGFNENDLTDIDWQEILDNNEEV
jgi:hypothetical protein